MAKKITDYPPKAVWSGLGLMDISTLKDALYISEKATTAEVRDYMFGTSFDVTINEAIITTLNTMNGGKGYELLPAPGANKTYKIMSDITMIWDIAAGTTASSVLTFYFDTETSDYMKETTTTVTPPIKFIKNEITQSNIDLGINQKFYLHSDVQHTGFTTGTLRILFDYKIIDV